MKDKFKERALEAKEIVNSSVFRYRSCNPNNLDALRKDRLYFSTPENFNDPYDNLMYVNVPELKNYISDCLEGGMKEYLQSIEVKELEKYLFGNAMWNVSLKKREEQKQAFLENVENDIEEIRDNILKNYKIICFCKNHLSMLMWSHYADNHKGFMLAYDENKIKQASCFNSNNEILSNKLCLKDVVYSNERVDMTQYVNDYLLRYGLKQNGIEQPNLPEPSKRLLREFINTKSLEWKYEEEIRLVPHGLDIRKCNNIAYINIQPRAIFAGAKISEENFNELLSIAKSKRIPLYQVWVNELGKEFKLNFQKAIIRN